MQQPAVLVEVGIRQRGEFSRPRLGGNGLQGRIHAVVNVFHGDTVAGVVVPNGKHAAEDSGVVFLKLFAADSGRRPSIVEPLAVEIVVIVTGGGHDVRETVADAHEFIALLLHVARLCKAVVPAVHDDVFGLNRRVAVGVRERTPEDGLLAIFLHIFNIVVGILAELLNDFFLGVGIFVRADMHALAAEHGLLAAEIFVEERVHKLIGLGIEKVEVVCAVLLAGQFGLVMRESERVCGAVDFGNDFHALLLRPLLQVDKFLLRVRAVLCREAGISVALQAEGSLRLAPVVAEELLETVVVEVDLQRVHLIIGHDAHEVAQVGDGNVLAAAVYHEAAQGVLGHIYCHALGQGGRAVFVADLQHGARSPLQALYRLGVETNALAYGHAVALFAKIVDGLKREGDVACFWPALCHSHRLARHLAELLGKKFCEAVERGRLAIYDNAPGEFERAFRALPFCDFGHGERFGINGLRLCCRREQERGEQQGEQPRHAFVLFHHIDIRFKV